ncbi:hypothetical protein D2U88_01225 [Flagellimonas aequoris]|uniref:Uncharacterized protein n=1 Tax=Flagellimonas aequoris TaxID=2306997 RepID=A0A418NBV0_9FLAO|nr:hypothetical protein D2U88_01225 [Allomuricauda aequoris]
MLKKIASSKTNYLSILVHVIGALTLYAVITISIFLLFYFLLDEGFGSDPNRTSRFSTFMVFYFPLICISSLIILRVVEKAKQTQFEKAKTYLITLIISTALYLYFWLK